MYPMQEVLRRLSALEAEVSGLQGEASLVGALGVAGAIPGDSNSRMLGDLSSGDWTRVNPSAAPTQTINAGLDVGGYLDGVVLNVEQGMPSPGYLAARVVADGTSMTFQVPMANGVGFQVNTVVLSVYDAANAVKIAATICPLTDVLTDYSVRFATVPGTEYVLRLSVNDTSNGTSLQAIPLCGRARVSSNGSQTPLLAQPYVGLHVTPVSLQDNGLLNLFSDRGPLSSALARLVFDTTATSMTMEFWSTLPGWPNIANLLIKVWTQGKTRPAAIITPTSFGKLLLQSFALPQGLKRVEIVNGATEVAPPNTIGTFLRRLYLPQASQSFFPEVAL